MRSLLLEQPGVLEAEVSFPEAKAVVLFDPNQTSAEALAQALSQYYPAQVISVEPAPGGG